MIRPFASRRIVLGVTGGIACYKSAYLARLLAKAGAEVDVVLTRAASEFVGAVTFEALTGRPVHTALIAAGHALDHIRLAKATQAIVVAPATADFMARIAHGHADDLLSACLLATEAPVLIAPAMNDRMWAHPQTQANAHHLLELGYRVLEPEAGDLAAGEGAGPGRMPEPETIFAHVGRLLERRSALGGRRVVVTAGPTREPVDPVRFLSNRSSGKMGVALASAAWRRGADVTLIAGPLHTAKPAGILIQDVETTDEMHDAVSKAIRDADVLIMAAAPADFRAAEISERKIKKAAAPDRLSLVRTTDILQSTQGSRRNGMIVVGFALETHDAIAEGWAKLNAKELDFVVVNDALEPGAGFAGDTNRVTLISKAKAIEELPLMSKSDVADAILDRVEDLLNGR